MPLDPTAFGPAGLPATDQPAFGQRRPKGLERLGTSAAPSRPPELSGDFKAVQSMHSLPGFASPSADFGGGDDLDFTRLPDVMERNPGSPPEQWMATHPVDPKHSGDIGAGRMYYHDLDDRWTITERNGRTRSATDAEIAEFWEAHPGPGLERNPGLPPDQWRLPDVMERNPGLPPDQWRLPDVMERNPGLPPDQWTLPVAPLPSNALTGGIPQDLRSLSVHRTGLNRLSAG